MKRHFARTRKRVCSRFSPAGSHSIPSFSRRRLHALVAARAPRTRRPIPAPRSGAVLQRGVGSGTDPRSDGLGESRCEPWRLLSRQGRRLSRPTRKGPRPRGSIIDARRRRTTTRRARRAPARTDFGDGLAPRGTNSGAGASVRRARVQPKRERAVSPGAFAIWSGRAEAWLGGRSCRRALAGLSRGFGSMSEPPRIAERD